MPPTICTRLRDLALDNSAIRRKIESLEKHYDEQFKIVFDALHRMFADDAQKPKIGFQEK
ncbi:MAG: hypothetical protein AAB839_01260 [Patescibacteria group bacterium]